MYPGAAKATAANDPLCQSIAPFYWEIGDARSTDKSVLAGGPIATDASTVDQGTTMLIASASKLWFGAYAVERNRLALALPENRTAPRPGSELDTAFHALTMRAGYDHQESDLCALAVNLGVDQTVAECFHVGKNDQPTLVNGTVDTTDFYYNGGNFQEYATDHLLIGGLDSAGLTKEYRRLLGDELNPGFKFPDLAGGMEMSAADYAAFLRKILSGQLLIAKYLDYAPVCTLPASEDHVGAPSCATATFSPAPDRPWQYSWGHWIETDGTYSSPGKLGFYPWIDKGVKYYGIVARQDSSKGAYIASAECGTDIRNAFFSGHEYKNGNPL